MHPTTWVRRLRVQVSEVMKDFEEPHGDRRQEIVFIGQELNRAAITAALQNCLCKDHDLQQVRPSPCLLMTNCFLSFIML